METYRNYIGGQWVESASGRFMPNTTPANRDDIIGQVPLSTKEEALAAVASAHEAFESWRAVPAPKRGDIVLRAWRIMEERKDAIGRMLSREEGKILPEALGEVQKTLNCLEYLGGEGRRMSGVSRESELSRNYAYTRKVPLGAVGLITPWNFPSSMITRKCAPALAVGCPVVIKPASQTPLSALALAVLAEEAGFPRGVINVITGSANEIGKELTTNPLVRKISFTGSTEVGKVLLSQCSSTVKKVSMELGGHAPFIVFDDADIDEAVVGAMQSKFRNTGQTCVCANRLFVHEKIYEEFVKKFSYAVSEIKVGDGFDKDVTSGPLIDENSFEKVEEHVQDAIKNGAKLEVGGHQHKLGGNFYQPTVLSNVNIKSKITHEETFGPVAPIYKFSSDEEVIKMANDTPYGLASYFYSRDIGRIWKVAEALEYGIVGVNTGLPSKAEIPFGGVKESGLGREGSKYGVDDFLEIKYVNIAGI